jgi:ABC-type multidrug transport system fused ATPase/permease subunit
MRIGMEKSFFRYILNHTWRDQMWLLIFTAASFPLIYVNLQVPKLIVNNALGGKNIPETVLGFPVDQVAYLMVLSFTLLGLITVNGAIKYYLNVFRGVIGERMVRRLRFDLYRHILRFPLPHFKKTSPGEIIPMVTAETDAIGGFIGDSIGLPAFQGGLLVTYLVFIFNQDFLLGLAAIALYPPQVWLIPKLQRKINALSKQRIQTTRQLADRVGETVLGAAAIRANDTSRYERADVSDRLGRIYAIRLEIFKRKYFVKFLNNFLAQVTPFFFYSVGGYFVIKGELSLGALVAVIAAYKDIADPWKELLKWYEEKEDVRVKYEQIVSQFEPEGIFPPEIVEAAPAVVPRLSGELVASGLTYSEDGAINEVDRLSLQVAPGETVALVGAGRSGKDEVTRLLARLVMPTSGRIGIGEVNLVTAPEAVTGRRVAFVSQNEHIFSGTLAHNLFYGLKHEPVRPRIYEGAEANIEARRVKDALASDNSPDDFRADWIDLAAAGAADADALVALAMEVLRIVEMDAEVVGFGLASTADPDTDPELVSLVLEARRRVQERVATPELAGLVELFDRKRYHSNISVAENLVFGTPRRPEFAFDSLARNPEIVTLLRDAGLLDDFHDIGVKVAQLMVELFKDVPPESDLFVQYSFINPDDLAEFQALLSKIADRGREGLDQRERELLLGLPFKIVESRHRLGIFDDTTRESLKDRIVAAREELRRRYADREDVVVFFDPVRFSPALSIQDNILFGRPAYEQATAQARISALILEVALEIGLHDRLVRQGLGYEVGINGGRLSYAQKQRLAIGRGLMKNADVLVFNEPTSGLDPASEGRLVRAVLERARGRTVVWALGRADLAGGFDRVAVLDGGRMVETGRFADLQNPGSALARILAAG